MLEQQLMAQAERGVCLPSMNPHTEAQQLPSAKAAKESLDETAARTDEAAGTPAGPGGGSRARPPAQKVGSARIMSLTLFKVSGGSDASGHHAYAHACHR